MSSDLRSSLAPPTPDPEYVTASYAAICKSHQALDDFRMKLLGLLPIASVVGLLTLEKSGIASAGSVTHNEIVAYVGLFAAMFTLALFVYEMRNILICHDLIVSGQSLEAVMNVPGQFSVCGERRQLPCYVGQRKRRIAQALNAKLAASGIYSLVFSAWLFVALRYGFAIEARTCAVCAVVVGLMLACGSYALLHFLVSADAAAVPDRDITAAQLLPQ
jgi:hypothetical protein